MITSRKCVEKRFFIILVATLMCTVAAYFFKIHYDSSQTKLALQLHEQHTKTMQEAHALMNQGKLDESYALYKNLISQTADKNLMVQINMSMGVIKERQNLIDEAHEHYKKALEIDSGNPRAHVALAGINFYKGDLKEGFKEYEWRWHISNMPNLQGKWDGSDVQGKTILLLAENGFGDVIQYVRFAGLLKNKGAKVIVSVSKQLATLFSSCDYIDYIALPKTNIPYKIDAITSLQTVPFYCDISLQTIPKPPYLKADNKLVEYWRKKLAHDKNFKIGLCWMSGAEHMQIPHMIRSMHLNSLSVLAGIKGVSFYSLQKGDKAIKQLKELSSQFKVIDFGESFDGDHGPFMDTAALMQNLDLVISIDTSVAHLAGALNVPTWILLPFNPDSRWMLDRSDTAWYPSVTLFRQPKPGDWQTVIAQVYDALQGRANLNKNS
jgi:tetratricopeptide (TPR) repeat protein